MFALSLFVRLFAGLSLCLLLMSANILASPCTAPKDNCKFFCQQVVKNFCGSDGQTYGNECFMRLAACRKGVEIHKVRDGACDESDI